MIIISLFRIINICAFFLIYVTSLPHEAQEELASLMEIGVGQPVRGGCYPVGARITPSPEVLLYVNEWSVTDRITSWFQSQCSSTKDCRSGWLQLCSVVSLRGEMGSEVSCGAKVPIPINNHKERDTIPSHISVLKQLVAPPLIHLKSSGCYSMRFEFIGGITHVGAALKKEEEQKTLLRKSNDIAFQVTSLFECSVSPVCASAHDVFSGVYQFDPIAMLPQDHVHNLLMTNFETKVDFMSMVSDSPKHQDVILSNSILLEVSRRSESSGEQRSMEEALTAQVIASGGVKNRNQLQLCVGLSILGKAKVSKQKVEVIPTLDNSEVFNGYVSSCLEFNIDDHVWRAVVTPPGSINHIACSSLQSEVSPTTYEKCIVFELVGDGVVDYVNISVPPFIWGSRPQDDHLNEKGIVVAVQSWLNRRESANTCTNQDRFLATRPKQVVLLPQHRLQHTSHIIHASELSAMVESNSSWTTHDELVLVMCRWKEDIDWLKHQPYRAVVYDKNLPFELEHWEHGFIRNIAGEASAFLKFIIDYYDHLPRRMLFLHSHRWAYHQEDIAILLANIPDMSEGEYCNINRVAWGHNEDQEQCWLRHHWDNSCSEASEDRPGGWLKRWLGDIPPPLWEGSSAAWEGPHLVERCCAQFIVSRDLIRSRPIGFYRHTLAQLYARVKDDDTVKMGSSRHYGLLLEWIWHVIFSQPASMIPNDESLRHSFQVLGPIGVLHADRIMLSRPGCVTRKRDWEWR